MSDYIKIKKDDFTKIKQAINNRALKTAVAPDSSKLGGKTPSEYAKANLPLVVASSNANQTVNSNINTKVLLQAVSINGGGADFNNSRFTASIPCVVDVNCTISTAADGIYQNCIIYKNGSPIVYGDNTNVTGHGTKRCHGTFALGAGDYVEMYCYGGLQAGPMVLNQPVTSMSVNVIREL